MLIFWISIKCGSRVKPHLSVSQVANFSRDWLVMVLILSIKLVIHKPEKLTIRNFSRFWQILLTYVLSTESAPEESLI